MQHIQNKSPEGKDGYQSKAPIILGYPITNISLCISHTKGTGNYPTNPNWLQVDQWGFGEQIMHSSKSVIGKGLKKHRVLQVRVVHSIHPSCGASARSEIAPGRL